MNLSPRLCELRGYYQDHQTVWDIGCDHGKLGLSFLEEVKVKEVHLVDPSLPAIESLKHCIDSYITKEAFKITIHLQRGQDIHPGPEKKIVLIAGMGGKEIQSICEHLYPFLTIHDDLVISPHRDILPLRETLAKSEFFLGKESLVFDDGRYYQVLSLVRRGHKKVHPFGKDIFTNEIGPNYLEQQLKTFSAHQDMRSRTYVEYLKSLTQCF